VKWTSRWIERAQRKADARAARYLRHEEGLRAGTEPPSFLDRIESTSTLFAERLASQSARSQAYANEQRIRANWPLASEPYAVPLGLADAWRTWVTDGPVRGPDGIGVTIWVRRGERDLPLRDTPDSQPRATLAEDDEIYTVCVRRVPAGPVLNFCLFVTENSARRYAIKLAWMVRQGGITGLRPHHVFPERPHGRRRDAALAAEIVGARPGSFRSSPGLPQRGLNRWRRLLASRH
jgi:hypothetical protein